MKKFSLLAFASVFLLSACQKNADLLISPEVQNIDQVQSLAKKSSPVVPKDKGTLIYSSSKVKKNYSYKKPIMELYIDVNITLTKSPKEPMMDFMKKFVTTKEIGDYEIFSKISQGKIEGVTLSIYDGDVNFITKTLFVDVYNYVRNSCEIFNSYLIDYSSGKATSTNFYPQK
ncbi:MAG: hypothetical protein AABZ74_05730 [Cyanobacteriota bacterium]